jgi:hypothetical protein
MGSNSNRAAMGEVSTKGTFLIRLLLSGSNEDHRITPQLSNAGKARGKFDEVLRKLIKSRRDPPSLSPTVQPHLNWLMRQIA